MANPNRTAFNARHAGKRVVAGLPSVKAPANTFRTIRYGAKIIGHVVHVSIGGRAHERPCDETGAPIDHTDGADARAEIEAHWFARNPT